MFSYITIACLLGAAAAAPSAIGGIGLGGVAVGSVDIPRYGFNYAVNDPITGDNKAQTESRDGGVVKGSYSLAEPDGTIRVVEYAADPVSGFNAIVKRIGNAVHPQQVLIQKPIAVAAPVAVAPIGITSTIGLGKPIGLGLGAPIGLGLGGPIGLGVDKLGLGGVGLGGLSLGGLGYGGVGLGWGGLGPIGLGLGDGLGWKH